MKKWIRFPGLIAFFVIIVFVGIVWLSFVDSIVKRGIEKTGTLIVGARVELNDADLSLFPVGLTLTRLQVTNPDKPMSNAVEVQRIAFNVDTMNLFMRKAIIDEMIVDNVQFNTPRQSSGAIPGKSRKEKKAGEKAAFQIPSFQVPDVKEILKNEKLSSLEEIEKLRTDIAAAQKQWDNKLSGLPDQNTFNELKERIEKLQKKGSGGIAGTLDSLGEMAKIQEEITKNIRLLETAYKDLDREMKSIQKRMSEIQNAPQKDIKRIMNKYSLTPEGLANMSQILFGPKISSTIHTALVWYGKLKPVVQRSKSRSKNIDVVKPVRGKGVNVRFTEHEPLPDMLIRTAQVSIKLDAGDLSGKIVNITPDQDVLGKPLDFSFSGEKLKGIKAVHVTGTLNHVIPDKSTDTLNAIISGLIVNNADISENSELPLTLEKGTSDIKVTSTLSGKNISSVINANVLNASLSSKGTVPSNSIAKVLVSALKDISHIELNARIQGTLEQYDVRISSNLDKVLSNAIGRQVKNQANIFEDKLKAGIMNQTRGPLEKTKNSLSGLDTINKELGERLKFSKKVFRDSGQGSTGGLKLPF